MNKFSIILLLTLVIPSPSLAATITISPENYGTIWNGNTPYLRVEATNNSPDKVQLALNDYGDAQAVISYKAEDIEALTYSYYYLKLTPLSLWSGIAGTTQIEVSV